MKIINYRVNDKSFTNYDDTFGEAWKQAKAEQAAHGGQIFRTITTVKEDVYIDGVFFSVDYAVNNGLI